MRKNGIQIFKVLKIVVGCGMDRKIKFTCLKWGEILYFFSFLYKFDRVCIF